MEGWISLHRSLASDPIWLSEPFTRGQAWADLLMLANHDDGFIRIRGVKMEVKRGQCGWSELKLSKRWRWSRGKTKRFILELKTVQQIEQQTNNVSSLISITNYNRYQTDSTASRTPNGHQTNTKQDTNNKENKENKQKAGGYSDEFSEWWKVYKKGNKAAAFKRWKEQKSNLPENLIELTRQYLGYCSKTDRAVKDGEGYLNGKYWEGEWTEQAQGFREKSETTTLTDGDGRKITGQYDWREENRREAERKKEREAIKPYEYENERRIG